MYTINIRGKQNPKDQKMVKLEMIFFKTGYARVPKVLNVTGLLKDWDAKSQSFRRKQPPKTNCCSICAPNTCTLPTHGKRKSATGPLSNFHIVSMR